MYRLILALATLWCVVQSLYMIWLTMAYNRGICRRCKTGVWEYNDVLEGAIPEDAEDAVTNVRCSHCGYKEYIPSIRLAKGYVPVFAIGMYLLSWVVLVLTIIGGFYV